VDESRTDFSGIRNINNIQDIAILIFVVLKKQNKCDARFGNSSSPYEAKLEKNLKRKEKTGVA
jgi:hypothetical protein